MQRTESAAGIKWREKMAVKIAFVSLGCDKNTIDSEIMLQLLTDHGYEITKNDEEAEVIVINTCGFIQDAKEESIQTIIEMGEYKQIGQCKKLVVTGCLAQRYPKEIQEELPEVDAVIGTGSYEKVVEVIDSLLKEEPTQVLIERGAIDERDLAYRKRIITTPGYYEYVRVSVGCDNHCTYCIIPKLRGKYRSRNMEDILHEVEDLAQQGVQELMVVAQDITKYGRDLKEKASLSDLLHKMCRIEGIHWIRLLYCYPEDITDELIETMAQEEKIVPYIDMPIQHCSDTVLRRMGRRHTKQQLYEVCEKLRSRIPEICLRTTLITGFPGETEEEFQEMCEFIQDVRFDRLGVFAYSQEEDTPAALMKDQIEEEEKQRRKDLLMQLQQKISRQGSEAYVGTMMEVIIEGEIPEEDEEGYVYSARSYRDAPDIDGFVFVSSPVRHKSGDFIHCYISGSYEYDLIGSEVFEDESEDSL